LLIFFLLQSFKGQGFDAVFDTLGEEEAFEHSKAVLKDKGAFATELPEYLRKNAGLASWAKQGAVTVGRKIASVASVGYHNAWASVKQQDLEALRLLIEGGDFKSVANHYFPLADALKAFELVRSGDCLGKVVVTIKDDKAADIEREFVSDARCVCPMSSLTSLKAVKGVEVAGPAASVALPAATAAAASPSPAKASSTSNDNNNNNNVEVARERDLGADDYEDEPAGMANPFH
jgi:hypothetical protein